MPTPDHGQVAKVAGMPLDEFTDLPAAVDYPPDELADELYVAQ